MGLGLKCIGFHFLHLAIGCEAVREVSEHSQWVDREAQGPGFCDNATECMPACELGCCCYFRLEQTCHEDLTVMMQQQSPNALE